jgi:branched-chain amino acid transport system ATP-binding protein/neutral amino acid transport system ATP-binding protein
MTSGTIIPALRVRDLRAGYARADEPGSGRVSGARSFEWPRWPLASLASAADGGDIVCGIDLDQAPETILAVIGPNGSGKSTLVKTIAGLLRPRTGSIAITGREITALSPAGRVSAGLAYVPQEANVFRGLTIRENLKLATEFLRGRTGVGPEQEAQVLAMFPQITGRMGELAGNLSGGQRQMLAFACALLANPEVMLLDEPSAGLSPRLVAEIMEAVVRVREAGVTVLLVEQNVTAALRVADEAVVLVSGRVAYRASAAEIAAADLADLFFARAS